MTLMVVSVLCALVLAVYLLLSRAVKEPATATDNAQDAVPAAALAGEA